MTRMHDERDAGASLILALVFLLVLFVIVAGLSTQATTDLTSVKSFTAAHARQSALRSALTTAITSERYFFNAASLNVPSSPCFVDSAGQPSSAIVIDTGLANGPNATVDTWCSTTWQPVSSITRNLHVYACLRVNRVVAINESLCRTSPDAEADVRITDLPNFTATGSSHSNTAAGASCLPLPTPSPGVTTCGQTLSIDRLLWHPTLPTVTSVALGNSCGANGRTVTFGGLGLLHVTMAVFVPATQAGRQNAVARGDIVSSSQNAFAACFSPSSVVTNQGTVLFSTPSGTSSFSTP